jgi:sugar phosphate isomerase/epimerase
MIFPETIGGSGPILETISKIAGDDFFSMVEITHIDDAEVRKQVANLIEVAHLRVAFGAQPPILSQKLNLNTPDPTKRKEAVSAIKALIDEAKAVGAKRLTVLSGPDPGEKDRTVAKELLIQSLLELCAYAREKSLSITLETFDRTVDKKSLIGPSAEALEVSKAVKAKFPSFGLMYDMGHAPLLSEDPAQALCLLKDHLVHVHIGNCVKVPGHPAYGDQHPRFGLEGGENDVSQLAHFLRALLDIGYISLTRQEVSPVVGFELKPRPGERPEVVIANGKRTWRKAWSLI